MKAIALSCERQAKCCTSASSLRVISCQNPVNQRGNPKPKAPKFKQNTAKRRGNPKLKGPMSEITFQTLDFADWQGALLLRDQVIEALQMSVSSEEGTSKIIAGSSFVCYPLSGAGAGA